MAIVRGNTQTVTNGTATSLAVNRPTGLANGDVLITTCGTDTLTSLEPSGFTWIANAVTTANEDVTVAYKVVTNAAGEPATYTWTGLGGRSSIAMTAYRGVDNATPLDIAAVTNTGTGSVSLSATTVTNGAMVYATAIGDWSTATMTVPAAMSEVFNLGNPGRRTAGADLLKATAGGTGTQTFTGSAGLSMAGIVFALRPSVAIGGSASGTVTWSGSATGDNGFSGGAVTGTVTRTGSTAGTNNPGPRGLTATPVSDTQINLSWIAASGAVGYDIERNGVVIVTNHTLTTYSDTGLTPSTTYTYRVRTVR